MKYVIIGGVAAGASTAARLRRLNEKAEIIVLDKGPFVSFSNCGLPYRLSGTIDKTEKLVLMSPEKLNSQYNLDVRVNSEVTSVNNDQKYVVVNTPEGEYKLSYDKLVLTPGAQAIVPPFKGLDLIKHFTLKTVPDTAKIMEHLETIKPKHMTVIGGGFIGVEAAENLREAGYEVTLIEGNDQILAPFDKEMSIHADLAFADHGIELIKGKMVDSFTETEVVLNDGTTVETDGVILSIGVKPDTAFLAGSSIEMTDRGYIVTDSNYQTSDKDVYAGGDAILIKNQITNETMPLALAGPANKQGRLIADHICGKKVRNNGYVGSSIIKVFDLTMASTGLNEKALANTDIKYEVAYAAPTDRVGLMPGVKPVILKVIFEQETGKILGGQAVSSGVADKRIDVLATAIKAEMDVYDLADLELTYAPPFGTGKDAINKMGYIATNLLEGDYKQVRFTDVYDLVKSDAQVIDVREANEYARGHVDGVVNIPMSEMRNRLDEIDSSKPVYVHCQTGQRSYNMTLMLQANGFEAYNVAGSYLLISKYEKAMQLEENSRTNILV
ncbi:FAD-dependent oxidoreductase [Mollicutes bacterium LVI A0078]|nr:FAD-dependent oxidoreductase [Mollicutes bacterium LVI A0075]WOO91836.1 FAD-dependent oxidoreductase [Mollicutes bacterium LVI A0078]